MIKSLYIKNFAIIKELDISFNSGFTVITGETGSGKTLILKAISIALGGNCDRSMVRHGSKSAIFEIAYDQSIVRRIIRHEGPSSSYFNDEPISLKELKKETQHIADFHGQYDQQLILNENYQLYYLDKFCNHYENVDSLKEIYNQITIAENRLNKLKNELFKSKDQKELILFQISEIESIAPKENEDETLDREFKILNNSEKITKILNEANISLSDNNLSIYNKLANTLKSIENLVQLDSNITNIADIIKQSLILIEQASNDINIYLASFDFDSQRLDETLERLNEIEKLKRKYGGSISAVAEFLKKIKEDIKEIDTSKNLLYDLENKIKSLKTTYISIAKELHKNRILNSKILSKEITKKMNHLEMPNSKFEIRITQTTDSKSFVLNNEKFVKIYPDGFDKVQFLLSTNPGQPIKPLSKIASGGEISRIMLGIKSVLQDLDPLDTLIFDEIDSGISGKAAQKVASHLKKIGKTKQVLCISHLAQIVSSANNHLHINKKIYDNNIGLELKYLNEEERPSIIKELFIGSNLIGELNG